MASSTSGDTQSPCDPLEWALGAIESNSDFNKKFLVERGWIVVPVESGCHFDELDAAGVSACAELLETEFLEGVVVEELAGVERVTAVPATTESILDFGNKFGHFACLLVPKKREFAILCTIADYFLVAGSSSLLPVLLGMRIEEAREAFDRYAKDPEWDDADRTQLMAVAKRYR